MGLLELAKKYSLTERTIRDVINTTLGERRYVTKNQVSMFEDSYSD